MTTFWIFAAGLMLLAIAFIVLPLLRKRDYQTLSADELNLSVFKQQLEELDNDLESGILDQQRYDAARRDLEKELLEDVNGNKVQSSAATSRSGRWIMSVALVVPLMSFGMYQALGNPEIIPRLAAGPDAASTTTTSPHGQGQGMQNLPPMEELVKKLAAKMEQQPDNLDGWLMLGRSYMALKRPQAAVQAYEKAMQLNPENTTLLLAYAEALGQMAGNDFTGKPAELISKAHSLNPEDPNGLWMMGIVSYQNNQFQDALNYWEKLEDKLTPQSKDIAAVQDAIGDAREKLGLAPKLPSIAQSKPSVQPAATAPAPAADGGKSAIEVILKLSPEFQDRVNPNDLVFIYAKALAGPPMPLAAARKRVKDLPLTIILDDSMAMMPQMKLSSFSEVLVGARISKSGQPAAQSGDLEGEIKPVTPGQSGPVMLTIDSVHP
jgi:cytochrome c-type biogenesis protein CcmH